MYTSKELSKKIAEQGFKSKSKMWWRSPCKAHGYDDWSFSDCDNTHCNENIKAYDIIYDICVKYPKQFFGAETIHINKMDTGYGDYIKYPKEIFSMLQQGKTQKEIEAYIESNCILFK